MSLAESACYTLINVPDTEPYNEMQMKQELGKSKNNDDSIMTLMFKFLQKKAMSELKLIH